MRSGGHIRASVDGGNAELVAHLIGYITNSPHAPENYRKATTIVSDLTSNGKRLEDNLNIYGLTLLIEAERIYRQTEIPNKIQANRAYNDDILKLIANEDEALREWTKARRRMARKEVLKDRINAPAKIKPMMVDALVTTGIPNRSAQQRADSYLRMLLRTAGVDNSLEIAVPIPIVCLFDIQYAHIVDLILIITPCAPKLSRSIPFAHDKQTVDAVINMVLTKYRIGDEQLCIDPYFIDYDGGFDGYKVDHESYQLGLAAGLAFYLKMYSKDHIAGKLTNLSDNPYTVDFACSGSIGKGEIVNHVDLTHKLLAAKFRTDLKYIVMPVSSYEEFFHNPPASGKEWHNKQCLPGADLSACLQQLDLLPSPRPLSTVQAITLTITLEGCPQWSKSDPIRVKIDGTEIPVNIEMSKGFQAVVTTTTGRREITIEWNATPTVHETMILKVNKDKQEIRLRYSPWAGCFVLDPAVSRNPIRAFLTRLIHSTSVGLSGIWPTRRWRLVRR